MLLNIELWWSKIQLSCDYCYFLKEILQIFCFLPESGKRRQRDQSGQVCDTGSCPLVSGSFFFCWVDHPGNDLSEQTCMHGLPSFCLTVLSTATAVPAKSSQLLMETSWGTFKMSCKNRNSLLWLQMPLPYQRFRLPDDFFQSIQFLQ